MRGTSDISDFTEKEEPIKASVESKLMSNTRIGFSF
jgi:hypothetical protein